MKTQIYDLNTRFNFGKHKGQTLKDVLDNYGEPYIGYLIYHDVAWFILDLETLNSMEKQGFFNDLHMSYYGPSGSFPLNDLGFSKDYIIKRLKEKYNEFTSDPIEYERNANKLLQEFLDQKNARIRNSETESSDNRGYGDFEIKDPIEYGSSMDPGENPWLDILPDDEADAAYWNTN